MIIFEDAGFDRLLPLVYWRAVFQLRCGRFSLLEKIRQRLGTDNVILSVRSDLADVVAESTACAVNPSFDQIDDPILLVNGRWLADRALPELSPNSCLLSGTSLLAARVARSVAREWFDGGLLRSDWQNRAPHDVQRIDAGDEIKLISFPWDLITHNPSELVRECTGDPSHPAIDRTCVRLICPEQIHVGENTVVKPGVVIDAGGGPVWIDENVTISPNAVIQGPCYIGAGSLIQPSAIIRENSSIGRVCKVGGEVEDVILHGYSNKQHHGFLGHAYVGEWVNMAAGTCNSDLKNTYGPIKVSLNGRDEIDTGLIFVGLFLGDHSKVGLNVCFPTGAVVGTSSSVFVSHYPPKFVPSFRWLTDHVQTEYDPEQGIIVAERAMARRTLVLSDAQRQRFLDLAEITRHYEHQEWEEGSEE